MMQLIFAVLIAVLTGKKGGLGSILGSFGSLFGMPSLGNSAASSSSSRSSASSSSSSPAGSSASSTTSEIAKLIQELTASDTKKTTTTTSSSSTSTKVVTPADVGNPTTENPLKISEDPKISKQNKDLITKYQDLDKKIRQFTDKGFEETVKVLTHQADDIASQLKLGGINVSDYIQSSSLALIQQATTDASRSLSASRATTPASSTATSSTSSTRPAGTIHLNDAFEQARSSVTSSLPSWMSSSTRNTSSTHVSHDTHSNEPNVSVTQITNNPSSSSSISTWVDTHGSSRSISSRLSNPSSSTPSATTQTISIGGGFTSRTINGNANGIQNQVNRAIADANQQVNDALHNS